MQLRPYQQEVHDECMSYLKQSNYQGPGIINASVGAGKSVLIAACFLPALTANRPCIR